MKPKGQSKGLWMFFGIVRPHFLVGSFSLKEKSLTITVGSFFSFSAYNLTLNGPLFTICSSVLLFIFSSTKFLKPESGGSILALNHNIFMLPKVQQVRPKGPPFGFFSALCDFFRKFSSIIKGYPLHFFEVFGL